MRSSFVLLFLTFAALALLPASQGQGQDGRRRRVLRVRGRPRNRVGGVADDRRRPAAPSGPAVSNSSPCPKKEGVQVYADPHSCHNFYKCTNGSLTYEECGNGLLFDQDRAFAGAVHNHCHYNWAVNCGERSEDEIAPRLYRTTEIPRI